jgi:hypothetical protein
VNLLEKVDRGLGRDRSWLVEFGFKVHRGLVTEGAVEPLSVVEDFDVFEDGQYGLKK